MNTITKNILAAATLVALGNTAAPAMAQGYYDDYNRVPLRGYGAYNGFDGYGGYANDYNYAPYYSRPSQGRRVLKTTLIGAGIGAGAGALVGLTSRRGRILKPALIGGGIGAGVGLGYGLLTRPRGYYGYGY
jgi:hypothetical protein